jgi:hypothetical protein
VGVKWAQGSSQHDKCQVGNMHTYSLDLVHFPIILSSFLHSLHTIICTLCVTMYLYLYLGIFGVEEVGCQAHGLLKKWVVRPMSILSR